MPKALPFVLCLIPLLAACPETKPNGGAAAGGALSGTVYWSEVTDSEIHKVDLATGADVTLGHGKAAYKAADGKVVFVSSDLSESDEALIQQRVIVKGNEDAEPSDNSFVDPQVSPDGKQIAYETLSGNVYVVKRADGALVARFEPGGSTTPYHRPTWVPDGRLVVAGGFGNPGLYVSDVGLTTMTRFDPNLAQPSYPAVSPDGTKVAFVLKNLVFVIGLDGTGLTQLDNDDDQEDRYPAWSPDGTQIAYFANAAHLKIRPAVGGAAIDVLAMYPTLADKIITFSSSHQFHWVQ